MATGTTTINFGAFPGTREASVAVTGQAGILSGSLVEAWIFPTATADHSIDEHLIDPPRAVAGTVVAGTGFTVYGYPRLQQVFNSGNTGRNRFAKQIDETPRLYGQWTVAWAWV